MRPLTDHARRVLEARYLLRDGEGRVVESPEELFARVAAAVARAESRFDPAAEPRWRAAFEQALATRAFLPNSPALMNAGRGHGTLAACVVLPVADELGAIFDALRSAALVQAAGGGTGFSFSHLRPRGERIASSGGTSCGPVPFVHLFDAATRTIRLGGRRAGANMGVLRADHPDALEFVRTKREGGLSTFDLALAVTDGFMEAVEADGAFDVRHPRTGRVLRTARARPLFDELVRSAHGVGDPGLLFLDAVARGNPCPDLGAIEATNPCGEVPLLPHESCTLGSIDLAPLARPGAGDLDWQRLVELVHLGVRFLDDVVEVGSHPLPELDAAARARRKVGLGVMGLADLFVALDLPYASDAALALAERVARTVAEAADGASRELAAERGVYPDHGRCVHGARGVARRNATVTSIAPTGTISLIAGTSPGIEPLFALAQRRRVLEGEHFDQVHPALAALARERGTEPAALLRDGRLAPDAPVDEHVRAVLATAVEVPPRRQLEVQAAFQRHVDNAVAKTVALPADADEAEVARTFVDAWRLGLKGVTVFRQASRPAPYGAVPQAER